MKAGTNNRIVAATLLALAGCGTSRPYTEPWQAYDGPAVAPAEEAVIYVQSSGFHGLYGFISAVDGKRTIGLTGGAPLEVHVLPGTRKVQVTAGAGSRNAVVELPVRAEAGHTYEITLNYGDIYEKTALAKSFDKGVGYVRRDSMYLRAKSLHSCGKPDCAVN